MTDFGALAVASALVWKIVSFLKGAAAGDKNLIVTQLTVWAAGIGVALLLANSDFAESIKLAGHALGSLNLASVVIFGVSLGSTASVGYDVKKAVDSSESAAEPRLL